MLSVYPKIIHAIVVGIIGIPVMCYNFDTIQFHSPTTPFTIILFLKLLASSEQFNVNIKNTVTYTLCDTKAKRPLKLLVE